MGSVLPEKPVGPYGPRLIFCIKRWQLIPKYSQLNKIIKLVECRSALQCREHYKSKSGSRSTRCSFSVCEQFSRSEGLPRGGRKQLPPSLRLIHTLLTSAPNIGLPKSKDHTSIHNRNQNEQVYYNIPGFLLSKKPQGMRTLPQIINQTVTE